MPEQFQTPPQTYEFCRQGRSLTAMAAAASWAALLVLLAVGLQASLWLTGLLALPLIPLLRDLWRNPAAGMTLDSIDLRWFSGAQSAEQALSEIRKVRFDTRWDFSVRVTLILHEGRKVRLPNECLPPHLDLERELTARELPPERHHFTVF